MNRKGLLIATLVSLLGAPLHAAPGIIHYQGRLTNASGQPITSPVELRFTFWDAQTGGNQLGRGWWDADTVTPDANGVYDTMIGDDEWPYTIDPDVFSGDSVWLNVNVSGEDLVPRSRIASAGYSLRAEEVKNVIKDMIVADDEHVDAGDVVEYINGKVREARFTPSQTNDQEFRMGETNDLAAAALTSSLFVVVYRTNITQGYAMIGDTSGTSIAFGSPAQFLNASVGYDGMDLAVAALDASRFVVVYGADSVGAARVASVSGTTPSFGTAATFNSAKTYEVAASSSGNGNCVIAYRDGGDGNKGKAFRCGASGTNLYWDLPPNVFNDTETHSISVTTLTQYSTSSGPGYSTSHYYFMVGYTEGGNGKAVVGDYYVASGPVGIPMPGYGWGSESSMGLGSLSNTAMVRLSTSGASANVAVAVGGVGAARLATVDGTTISWKGSWQFFDGARVSIGRLADDRFAVAHKNYSNQAAVVTGTVASGGAVCLSSPYVINSSGTSYSSHAALGLASPASYVVLYETGGTLSGRAFLGTMSMGPILGVAKHVAGSAESVRVILNGVYTHYSSLYTPGTEYYAGNGGTLSSDPTSDSKRAGFALSATDLLVDVER